MLGTVVGMIETFQSITLFGTGDPKLMAGGISQALVTTMLGLIAAVPLLFVHNILESRSRSITQVYEEQAIGFIASFWLLIIPIFILPSFFLKFLISLLNRIV